MPAAVIEHVIPVGWLLAAGLGGGVTLLGIAWRGFTWLRGQINDGFERALTGETFQGHVRKVVAEAFTGREEADRVRFAEMARLAERLKVLQERLEEQRGLEQRWHEDTRRDVARALEQASRFPAEVARQYQGVRQAIDELRQMFEAHERRLAELERR